MTERVLEGRWRDHISPASTIEVRVIADEQLTSWTVEGWRGGERKYIRAGNRTADEAWHYGDEWMRGEMLKNAKETNDAGR